MTPLMATDSLRYRVVFDVCTYQYLTWRSVTTGIVCVVVVTLMASAVNRLQGSALVRYINPMNRWLRAAAILVVAMMALQTWVDYHFMCGILRRHAYRELEGVVTEFVPEGDGGHRPEKFRVAGVQLSYSTFRPTLAFNQTAPHGGPIRDGLHVRIAEVNGEILRLEIGQ